MPEVRLGKFWNVWISLSVVLIIAVYLKPIQEKSVNKKLEATVVKPNIVKGFPLYNAPKLDFLLEYNHLKELLTQ